MMTQLPMSCPIMTQIAYCACSIPCDTHLNGKHSAIRSHGSWPCAADANDSKAKNATGTHLVAAFELFPASLSGVMARKAYSPRSIHDTAHAAVVERPSFRLPNPLTEATRNVLPRNPDAATTTCNAQSTSVAQ
jgi:hypothetical protein